MTEPPSLPPNPSPPTKYALILYPNFEVLDVFGPLEALNTVSRIGPPAFTAPPPAPPDTEILTINPPLSLYILAETLDPVYSGETKTGPFCQAVVPTHTFDDAPDDIEVLMVPGGIGDSVAASEFIKQRFGSIRYLFSVCTGANIVARAKVLNGWRATTNKKAWGFVTSQSYSAHTYWVADARWVVSGEKTPEGVGKIWTTSGVSAGTDGMIAFISAMYGGQIAEACCDWMEYYWNSSNDDSRFAKVWGDTDVPPRKASAHEEGQ